MKRCLLYILLLNLSLYGMDTDRDGLYDSVETNTGIYVSETDTGTNPNNADTDGDGVEDFDEIIDETNPNASNSYAFSIYPSLSANSRDYNTDEYTNADYVNTLTNNRQVGFVSDGPGHPSSGISRPIFYFEITEAPTNVATLQVYVNNSNDTPKRMNVYGIESTGQLDTSDFITTNQIIGTALVSAENSTVDGNVSDNTTGKVPLNILIDLTEVADSTHLGILLVLDNENIAEESLDIENVQSKPHLRPRLIFNIFTDTDGDGLDDSVETNTGIYVSETDTGTDPNNADTDGDTLYDGVETNSGSFVDSSNTGTNPNSTDSDGDGFTDDYEINTSYDPTSSIDTPDAELTVKTAIELEFHGATGGTYRIEHSTDLGTWSTVEENIQGESALVKRLHSIDDYSRRYFRVIRTDQ